MKENRPSYLLTIFAVIIIGIVSRQVTFIPFFIGDLLYAVMVYFGIRFLFIPLKKLKCAIIALSVCYCIELLQLYNAQWINDLRNTLFGRYVLGQGFLWTDILSYTLGILVAFYAEKILFSRT